MRITVTDSIDLLKLISNLREFQLNSILIVQGSNTALHRSSWNGHVGTTALLLDKGADINAKMNVCF